MLSACFTPCLPMQITTSLSGSIRFNNIQFSVFDLQIHGADMQGWKWGLFYFRTKVKTQPAIPCIVNYLRLVYFSASLWQHVACEPTATTVNSLGGELGVVII